MRQGKLSELIHNSGDQRPDYCQVDIHFQMVVDDLVVPQKADVVPDSELIISRKVLETTNHCIILMERQAVIPKSQHYLKIRVSI